MGAPIATKERRARPRVATVAPQAQAADRVYEAIYAAIVDHRLGPGTRLREEELARAFTVSRTLVRQALHRLAQDGVILLRPNRGAQVPEPTRSEGAFVFDARRVVECEVVRRLAGQLTRAQMAALRRIVNAEAVATDSGRHREAIRLSGAFHLELARLSGNPLFVRMLEELLPTSSLLMALYKAPGEPMCVAHSHRALLGVLDEGSGARAATEMRRHLGEIERSLDQPTARRAPALRDVFGAYREGASPQEG
jgi:DNA-binding GntR family transcriptional regulator